jgi:hypothetical protein
VPVAINRGDGYSLGLRSKSRLAAASRAELALVVDSKAARTAIRRLRSSMTRDADWRNAYELTLLRRAAMYLPNFLDGFDRLVAFDAETTGKRTPDAEFIRKQPFAWRPLASSSRSVSSKCCAKAMAGARARRGTPGSTRMVRSTPRPLDPQDSPRRSQERSTVPDDPAESERLRCRLVDRGPRL